MTHSTERRAVSKLSLAITASLETTPAINKSGLTTGEIYVHAGSAAVTLTFYAAPAADQSESAGPGTFLPVYDDSNAAITRTVAAGRTYRLPLDLAGARWIKIVGDTTATISLDLQG
jgi:hypothetical protein